jgi:hypothetical protein
MRWSCLLFALWAVVPVTAAEPAAPGVLPPEERADVARQMLAQVAEGNVRYESVTALSISGYCRESADALTAVACEPKCGPPLRWDAAMGLINFLPKIPADIRRDVRVQLLRALDRERDKLPHGVMMTLIEWGDADQIRDALGERLRGHAMEVAVLARVSSHKQAAERLWQIYDAAPPVRGTGNVCLTRRWHVGYALLGHRDKRGVDILLECLTVKHAPDADMNLLGGSLAGTFLMLAEALQQSFGYSPGLNPKWSPELQEATADMVAWWKANRQTWEFGEQTIIVRLGADAEPGDTCRPELPATQPEPEWSKADRGLEARLAVRPGERVNGTTVISTFLILRNVSDVANTMRLGYDRASITFRLVDEDGKEVPKANGPYDGEAVADRDLALPHDSELRFNISGRGLGIPANKAALIDLGPTQSWVIDRMDKRYYLSAVLVCERVQNPAYWHGRLELPRVEIPR